MKKTFIASAIVLSVVSYAFAQDATNPRPMPRPLPKKTDSASSTRPEKPTISSSAIDPQVKALREEMELRIKAIREEYEVKIKALIGGQKPYIVRPDGSTTTVPEARHERNDLRKDMKDIRKEERASSTRPLSGFFNALRGYFGGAARAEQ